METICFREEIEQREYEILAPYAAKAAESRGREKELEPCPLRTVYQRDRDRIIHCKSFRRLKHKTQVFLSPEGDHYRTRLTHTLEVSQIARPKSRCLKSTRFDRGDRDGARSRAYAVRAFGRARAG
jgi:dGTPase